MSRTSSSWRSGPSQAPQRSGARTRDVGLLAGVAVVDRQPVAPPQLPRDAPRADVLHPVEVDRRPALGRKRTRPSRTDLDRRPRQLVHAHEPLQRDQRLDRARPSGASTARRGCRARWPRSAPARSSAATTAARACGDRQPREGLPRLRRHAPVLADHAVLRRGRGGGRSRSRWGRGPGVTLSAPRAEVRLDVLVGDHRQAPPDERQDDLARRRGARSARPPG